MTQDPTTAAQACYRHPDRSTLLSCSRCGRPICGACSIEAAVGQRCPECVREQGVQERIPATPRQRRQLGGTPATIAFLALSVGFYILGQLGLEETLVRTFAQVNIAVDAGEWWRIFTVVLLHGSLMHLVFNMWALWILGPQVERAVGTWPFVGLYLASAGMGGVFAFYFGGPFDVGVGASGAIFGLFGVWLNWAVRRRNTAWGRALLGQLGFLLLINAALPFMIPSISWQAHLGGLLTGFVIGEVWSRIKGSGASQMRSAVAFALAVLAAIAVLI